MYHSIILIFVFINVILAECPMDQSIKEFSIKEILNPWPTFTVDPYKNQTSESIAHISQILRNRSIVCAVKFNDIKKQTYYLQDFSSKEEAESSGYIVTHQGQCGACSNLKDLALYLKEGLTDPVRICGIYGTLSLRLGLKCLRKLGFSDSCSEIWIYNTINTRKNCGFVCMISWMKGESNTKPDGTLNDCLQCDEDKSGPIFKYYSGRTRRNSGIHSEIDRPDDQIYNLTHCYY